MELSPAEGYRSRPQNKPVLETEKGTDLNSRLRNDQEEARGEEKYGEKKTWEETKNKSPLDWETIYEIIIYFQPSKNILLQPQDFQHEMPMSQSLNGTLHTSERIHTTKHTIQEKKSN